MVRERPRHTSGEGISLVERGRHLNLFALVVSIHHEK